MDDMKKLIEKYKQELMAYRKEANQGKTASAAPLQSEETKPQIIGYADNAEVSELYKSLFEENDEAAAFANEKNTQEDNEESAALTEAFFDEEITNDEYQDSKKAAHLLNNPNESSEYGQAPTETIFDFEELIENPEQMFTPPLYNEISPFGEIQSEITEQSRAEDNPMPTEPLSSIADNSPTDPLPLPAETLSVSPETAERLTEQPISGTNPAEQLTGRSFENEERPANDPADIKPNGNGAPAANYEERSYESYAEFERENPRTGSLRFRTFTARGALPVSGAVCVVTKTFGSKTEVLSTQTTDISGQTDIIQLPAPPRSLSLSPNSTILPYALYNAAITANGFEEIVLKNIPIFEDILSVQNAALVPSPPDNPNESETIDEAVLSGGE